MKEKNSILKFVAIVKKDIISISAIIQREQLNYIYEIKVKPGFKTIWTEVNFLCGAISGILIILG